MIRTMEFDHLEPEVHTALGLTFSFVPDIYNTGAIPLKMHVVYPAKAPEGKGYPVLIWICGGGWECCEPENRLTDMALFAKRGYIVCLAEYRISNTAPFPAQIIDVKTAIRFVRANAEKFRADPDRIAVMGDSAGGHLVSLAGLTPDKPEFKGDQWSAVSDRVQAVVDWYGVVDLVAAAKARGADRSAIPPTANLVKLLGGYPQDKMELAREASPIEYVSPSAPPFLILHGDKDTLVPFAQSQALYDKLTAAGVPCDLIIVKGAAHASVEFSQEKLLAAIADWLDENMEA